MNALAQATRPPRTQSAPTPRATTLPRRRRGAREAGVAALFLLPALLALVLLRLWPLAEAIGTSTQAAGLGKSGFVGLDNFARILGDATFLDALKVTLLFTLVVNPFQILLALAFAVILVQRIPAVGVWRSLIFLPSAVPQSVSAIIWGIAFRPDGPLNGTLRLLGIPAQPFLTSEGQALMCIVLVVSWVGIGFWMMFLIAGLNDIPRELYEAASVDGAGWFRTFFTITIPQLRRPLLFVLVADTVANFLIFAPVQILTRGGPNGSTNLVMVEIFNRAFVTGDAAGAAAGTILLVLVVLAIVSIQFRLLPGKE
jgi:multiple sugar transport system permease protein